MHCSSCRNIFHLITSLLSVTDLPIKRHASFFLVKMMLSYFFAQLAHSHQGRMEPLPLTPKTLSETPKLCSPPPGQLGAL